MRYTKLERYQLEQKEEWDKSYQAMPFINLRLGYSIQVNPPRNGAMLRFAIKYEEKLFSVYYDTLNALGYCGGEPYYEVYPIDGDGYRAMTINEILMQIYIESEGYALIQDEYPEYFV